MCRNVQHGPNQGQRCQQRSRHGHVGKLADGRVGQAALQVVSREGDHRGGNDGEASQGHQPIRGTCLCQGVDAKCVDNHFDHTEDAGLDHSHGVQQGRHWRRCHHGSWQPAVKRHQRGFANTKNTQGQQEGKFTRLELVSQDATDREIRGAGNVPNEHQRRQ